MKKLLIGINVLALLVVVGLLGHIAFNKSAPEGITTAVAAEPAGVPKSSHQPQPPKVTASDVAIAEAEQQQAIEALNDTENEPPPKRLATWTVVDKTPIDWSGDPNNYILQYPKISQLVNASQIQPEARKFAKIVQTDLAQGMKADISMVVLKDSYLTDDGYAYRFEIAGVSCDYRRITVDPVSKQIHEQYLDCG